MDGCRSDSGVKGQIRFTHICNQSVTEQIINVKKKLRLRFRGQGSNASHQSATYRFLDGRLLRMEIGVGYIQWSKMLF